MKIGIIGYGNMAKALCSGFLRHPSYHLQIAAPSLQPGHPQPHCHTYTNNVTAIQGAEIVILAVKPAQMRTVLMEIHSHLSPSVLVISVAAGLDMQWFSQYIPPHTPLVRAIPNLAAAYQQSATPLLANDWVTASQKQVATELFQQCGHIAWIDQEKDLDTITALAGSGIAYLFAFTHAMSTAAITLGLSPDIANRFAVQTLAGAASLASLSEHSLPTLQQHVTSKGGTTAAALDVFKQHHLSNIVLTAMQAAVARSQTLRLEEL